MMVALGSSIMAVSTLLAWVMIWKIREGEWEWVGHLGVWAILRLKEGLIYLCNASYRT